MAWDRLDSPGLRIFPETVLFPLSPQHTAVPPQMTDADCDMIAEAVRKVAELVSE
mgnify:CR=1 FL=1